MNHWQETSEILARLGALAAAGRRAALATVVRIEGSAYRRPGAKLLVEDSGATLGGVSGGCLEADVREVAKAVLETGRPRLRRYDTRTDENVIWGLGLGCNGIVEVFVQPATEGSLAALAARLAERLAGEAPFALATSLAGGEHAGAALLVTARGVEGSIGAADDDRRAAAIARAPGATEIHALPGGDLFVERFAPPARLVVVGAGDDAIPLVALAADAGFRVTVVDHRAALLAPARFPAASAIFEARPEDPAFALPPAATSLAVVKTHSLAHDREWARRLLAAGYPFVGLLGPRARTGRILEEIGAADDPRVYGPVGLDLGAEGARQIAVAIVAELLAVLARREPRHLRVRAEAIHAV